MGDVSRIAPCRYCQERSAECHARCERYAEWRREHEAMRGKYRKSHLPDAFIIEQTVRINAYKEKQK